MARSGGPLRRAIPTGASGDGLYLGRVVRVTAAGAFVEVPALTPGFHHGPCRYPDHLAPPLAGVTAAAGEHGHLGEVAPHDPHHHHVDLFETSPPSPDYLPDGHTHHVPEHDTEDVVLPHELNVEPDGSHVHDLPMQPPLAAGDAVVVAFLAGGHDDLVVLVRLT